MSIRFIVRQLNAHRSANTKLDKTTLLTIIRKLRVTWSPEQIVAHLYMGKIAFLTIYRWFYWGNLRAHDLAPAKGQAPKTSADLRAYQRQFDHPRPPVGGAHRRDVRAQEAKHGGF